MIMQCNIGAGGGCDAITARVDNLMGVFDMWVGPVGC